MSYIGFQYYDGPKAIVGLPEAASQTFVSGDLVQMASGSVAISTTYATIWGVALSKASGTTDNTVYIDVIMPGSRWVAQCSAATAETQKGNGYDLSYTSGSMCVNQGSNSYKNFIIEELDPRQGADSSAGGLVIGRFNTQYAKFSYV
jgi:hypothetical protein